jgi:hypothetical protein
VCFPHGRRYSGPKTLHLSAILHFANAAICSELHIASKQNDIFALCFFDNSGDQELFGFPSSVEGIHAYCADSTMVPEFLDRIATDCR